MGPDDIARVITHLQDAMSVLEAHRMPRGIVTPPPMIRPPYEEIGWDLSLDTHPLAWNQVGYLVLHHDGGPWHVNKSAMQIHRAHRLREPPFGGIGYHGWIEWTGLIAVGRPLEMRGAHVGPAYNSRSWGCGLAGNYTIASEVPGEAWASAVHLFAWWKYLQPGARIVGHKELPGLSSACPGSNLDMEMFRHDVGVFLDDVLEGR